MRILALFGASVVYGSERANLEVLSVLRDQGARVRLICTSAEHAFEARDYAAAHGFDFVTAPYVEPPRPYNTTRPWRDIPLGVIRASWRFLSIHRDFRPTHIHAGNQTYVLNFLPALALVRTPLVYRCGDAPALHNAVWRFTWGFIARRAAQFGAVSRYIADKMTAAGAPSGKINVVYSKPPRRSPETPFTRTPVPGEFTIGFIGQVIAEKGVGLLIDAFRQVAADFPTARLLIAGRIWEDWDGDTWGRDLREAVQSDPLIGERVEFLGFVEDIPGFLSHCRILAAPTLMQEPMGNVVMEAKQAGLASIIFRSGGFPEVIDHGATGYVCEEKTAEALAGALRGYLADPGLARVQGEAARASLTALGVDRFAERWAQIYSKAAR